MIFRYTFTQEIVRNLLEIEAASQAVRLTVLPPHIAETAKMSSETPLLAQLSTCPQRPETCRG